MSKAANTAIERLLGRRDPPPDLLVDLERMNDEGTRQLAELLRAGVLSYRKQRRALLGLGYTTKHAGWEQHRLLLGLALERIDAADVSLRSRAVHAAAGSIPLLKALRASAVTRGVNPEPISALESLVVVGLRRALELGVDKQATGVAEGFLSRANA